MLRIRPGETSSQEVTRLIAYVLARREKYPDTAAAIERERSDTASEGKMPYFTYIFGPPAASAKKALYVTSAEDMPLAPLERDKSDILSDLCLSYLDESGVKRTLVYDTRICPHCHKPLNKHTGEMDIYVASVFGIRNIGKTQFANAVARKCAENAFHRCGFVMLPDKLNQNQQDNLDEKGQMPATPDLMDNEDDMYSFVLAWTSKTGEKRETCLVLQDTPGERMLEETNEEKRMELIAKVVQSNILLLFSDPTRSQGFAEKIALLLDSGGANAPSAYPYYFAPELTALIQKSKSGHKYLRPKNAFPTTVQTLCEGLEHIRGDIRQKAIVAVVYTKLDFIEFFHQTFRFYTGRYPQEDLLFVDSDPVFAADCAEADEQDLWRDWSEVILRGQSFMESEDNFSLKWLTHAFLKNSPSEIPCFLIANGSLQLDLFDKVKAAENQAQYHDAVQKLQKLEAEAARLNPEDSHGREIRAQIAQSILDIRALIPFDNTGTKSCLPLILWIIKAINPSGMLDDLAASRDSAVSSRKPGWLDKFIGVAADSARGG
jgi:hypothetical protein